jgi:dTDP-4-dehydrorhamnose reductase
VSLRLAVTGTQGQLVRSLVERASAHVVTVLPLGRPHLDLANPDSIMPALLEAKADVIVSAAAYTAVDQAESEPDLAFAINRDGAAAIGRAAASLAVPLIHISTDYVFDGGKPAPYQPEDATGPTGVYGQSKLEGERAVLASGDAAAILRTAWVYGPFGKNFVRTMLRLGQTRDTVRVVADQRGNPTSSLDLADAVIRVAGQMAEQPSADQHGIFHATGQGETHWAGFAEAIFACSRDLGGPWASVEAITTADYPTPARRPANSALDGDSLKRVFDTSLPPWQESLPSVVARLLKEDAAS